ncbi:hypothetical protein ACHHYP_13665 [Achlya hypogyna]|uniref:PWWP domain-containing protein n=1 Tax=Achlya hypogyna TaxID=1202772 RepID=A0A1V9YET0_ACHHY|nr:hypothetical protein ACHHYP_13665 [Achlya hypogyna]
MATQDPEGVGAAAPAVDAADPHVDAAPAEESSSEEEALKKKPSSKTKKKATRGRPRKNPVEVAPRKDVDTTLSAKLAEKSKLLRKDVTDRYGEVVWAMMRCYPYWPAYICDPSTLEESTLRQFMPSIDSCFWVFFYKSNNFGAIPYADVAPWEDTTHDYRTGYQPDKKKTKSSKPPKTLAEATAIAEREFALPPGDRAAWMPRKQNAKKRTRSLSDADDVSPKKASKKSKTSTTRSDGASKPKKASKKVEEPTEPALEAEDSDAPKTKRPKTAKADPMATKELTEMRKEEKLSRAVERAAKKSEKKAKKADKLAKTTEKAAKTTEKTAKKSEKPARTSDKAGTSTEKAAKATDRPEEQDDLEQAKRFAKRLLRCSKDDSKESNEKALAVMTTLIESEKPMTIDVLRDSQLPAAVNALRTSSNPNVAKTASALRKLMMMRAGVPKKEKPKASPEEAVPNDKPTAAAEADTTAVTKPATPTKPMTPLAAVDASPQPEATPPAPEPTPETADREVVQKLLLQVLPKAELCKEIETALYDRFSDTTEEYKSQARTVVFGLRNHKVCRQKVLSGALLVMELAFATDEMFAQLDKSTFGK